MKSGPGICAEKGRLWVRRFGEILPLTLLPRPAICKLPLPEYMAFSLQGQVKESLGLNRFSVKFPSHVTGSSHNPEPITVERAGKSKENHEVEALVPWLRISRRLQ